MQQKATLYHWDKLPKESVRPGVERVGFSGDDVLMVMNTLQPGMEVRPHSHPFEQLAYIVSGRMKFTVGDEVFDAGPGSVIRIPANVEHCGEPMGDEPVLNLDVFSPIREDYRHLVEYQQPDFGRQ